MVQDEETQVIGGDSGVRSQLQSPPHSNTATHALRWRWKLQQTQKGSLDVFQCPEFSLLPKDCPSPELSPTTLMAFKKETMNS